MMKTTSGENPALPLLSLSPDIISSSWKSNEIVVSILCATFQHEDFIEDALRGFLAQKTNFKFEVIVRDDCSSDRTAEIIKHYEDNYTGIVKGIYEPFNKWPSVKASTVLRNAAKGKYIAFCEGDDYWIDEYKLQKQVDYLEKHPEVSLLETHCVWVEGNEIIKNSQAGGTRTMMYRNDFPIPEKYSKFIFFGDGYLKAVMRERGKFALLDDVTAVWRKHPDGVFGSLVDNDTRVLNLHRSQTQAWIAQQFYDDGKTAAANKYMAASLRKFFDTMGRKELFKVLFLFLTSPMRARVGRVLRILNLR